MQLRLIGRVACRRTTNIHWIIFDDSFSSPSLAAQPFLIPDVCHAVIFLLPSSSSLVSDPPPRASSSSRLSIRDSPSLHVSSPYPALSPILPSTPILSQQTQNTHTHTPYPPFSPPRSSEKQMPHPIQQHDTGDNHAAQLENGDFIARRRHAREACRGAFERCRE